MLEAWTWSSQLTLSASYLRDVAHRHLDTFSIGPVAAAQQVMSLTNPCSSGVVTPHSSLWLRSSGLHAQCMIDVSFRASTLFFYLIRPKGVAEAVHQGAFWYVHDQVPCYKLTLSFQ